MLLQQSALVMLFGKISAHPLNTLYALRNKCEMSLTYTLQACKCDDIAAAEHRMRLLLPLLRREAGADGPVDYWTVYNAQGKVKATCALCGNHFVCSCLYPTQMRVMCAAYFPMS